MDRNPHHTSREQQYRQEALFDMEREPVYKQLDSPELRYRYVNLTENLIANAIEQGVDTMVFLDKSARPVAWLMHDLWPTLARDGDGNMYPEPEIKFANIDREQWGPIVGRSEDKDGTIDISRIHPDAIDSLRRTFSTNSNDLHSKRQVKETVFTGRDILIVDEVRNSGDTLSMASQIFATAFPDAQNIYSTHWMTPKIARDPKSGMMYTAEMPVWYQKQEVRGRLVANRDETASSRSRSIRQRMGRMFLSTRFQNTDERGVELRKEMRQLADEVARGTMPVRPSRNRDMDSSDYIMEYVNGVSYREYKGLLEESERKGSPAFATLFSRYKRDRAKRR